MTARLNRRTTALRPAVVVAALAVAAVGVVAPSPATAADDPIDVLPIAASHRWAFGTGDAMQDARDLLLHADNFGPGAVVDRSVLIHTAVAPGTLSAADLVGIDVVASTLITETWSTEALEALDDFVAGGGALLVTEEGASSSALSTHFGLTQGPSVTLSPPTGAIGTVLAPGTHPVTDGPFGTTTTFDQYATLTWYTSLGPDATALAVNDGYRYPLPLAPEDASLAGTALAVIPPAQLAAGSGPVVFVSDTDTFSRAYICNPGPSDCTVGGIVTHPELLLNTFAWLADPTGFDADGDGISDRADIADPVAPSALTAAFGSASIGCPAPGTTSNTTLAGTWTDSDSSSWDVEIDWAYDGTFVVDQVLADLSTTSYSATRLLTTTGVHAAAVRVTDDSGLSAGPVSTTIRVAPTMSGLLAPFNADGSSVWKYGSTVPVRVRITDCSGSPVPGLSPTVGTQLVSSANPSAGIDEVTSTSGADTGSTMRFDGGQYMYNLATKSLADGSAQYLMYVREASAGQTWQRFGVRLK